jgi:hypothetical protein
MYEASAGFIGYPYTPALPILLAPFAWIGQHFGLTDSARYPVMHPTMFLLWGPVMTLAGTLPLLTVTNRMLASTYSTARRVGTQWCLLLAVSSAPLVYFHPEDTIACALLLASAQSATKGRWKRVGAFAGAAVLFKQWAAIPAVIFVMLAPPVQRLRVILYTYAIPLLIIVPFLLTSPHATWQALTGSQATLTMGHRQLWTSAVFGSTVLSNVTPLRLAWCGVAIAVGALVKRNPTLVGLIAAVGVVMLARNIFEPTIFAYYLAPAFLLAILCAALCKQPYVLRTACAVVLQLWGAYHIAPGVAWWAVLGAGVAYVCSPFVTALRGHTREVHAGPELVPVPA